MRKTLSVALLTWLVAAVAAAMIGSSSPSARADEKTPEYVGPHTCKKCHFKQYKSWTKGQLSQAFADLKPGAKAEAKTKAGLDPKKDYTKDPKCLKCHVTAYGKPSGYPEVKEGAAWSDEETKRAEMLEGVTCEACHGPGSIFSVYKKDHKDYKIEDVRKMGLISPPPPEQCAPCHAKECPTMGADYKFDYKEKKDSEKVHKHSKLKHKH
jgi:ribosomal protein S18